MNDITANYRFQQILVESAHYRVLREIYKSDPDIGPNTATALRDCFRSYRDDAGDLHSFVHRSR
jgi:hypothetical protein